MRVIVGVSGGIAAYKSASLVRLFTEAGHSVKVIPTEAALKFVGAPTWEALSAEAVSTDVFDSVAEVAHVQLGAEADLVVVAPATADILARAAAGLATDLLTTTLLVAQCPIVFAPAMHTQMWQHPATVANVATLRARGVTVIDPAVGRLTGADSGAGRLPEPQAIFDVAIAAAASAGADGLDADAGNPALGVTDGPPRGVGLRGRTVLITAGGTREPLDPVRFLGNRSSGKQGLALAEACLDAGAEVVLIAGAVEEDLTPLIERDRVRVIRIETALELERAVALEAAGSDVVIMAAAVADFRPADSTSTKIKKRDNVADPTITLVRNPDVLLELVAARDQRGAAQLIVGFAAETGDEAGEPIDYARAKLQRKGCDLLVLNRVGVGVVFGRDETEISILSAQSQSVIQFAGSKAGAAVRIVETIGQVLEESQLR